jgi:hypothetical protein
MLIDCSSHLILATSHWTCRNMCWLLLLCFLQEDDAKCRKVSVDVCLDMVRPWLNVAVYI